MIQSLPVELILILLRGSSVADILNFTRTSAYFRCISLTNRRLWIDAADSYRIRLPLGETLRTTDLSLLPRNAARGASIVYKWQHHHLVSRGLAVQPIRIQEATLLYNLPAWAFWGPLKYSQRTFVGHAPPAFINVLPGGRAFLFGSMGHLGVYGLHGEYGYELDIPTYTHFEPQPGDRAATVAWDSVDNGAHIRIAVISKALNGQHDMESKLCVFEVDFTRSVIEPRIRRTHIFTLPVNATAVSIKKNRILVRSSSAFLVIDLTAGQRGCWLLPDTNAEITSAIIHPTENSVLLVVHSLRDHATSVQRVDLPHDLESFAETPVWPCYPCKPRPVARLPAPQPAPSQTIYSSIDADGAMFREFTTRAGPRAVVVSSTLISKAGSTKNASYAVNEPLAVLRSSYNHQMLVAFREGALAVLESTHLDDERSAYGYRDVAMLKLGFPAERMPGVGRAVAFDDVYGIMLVFARGRLFVVQY
ncbi:hypothetical protein C8R43DRAFT_1111466 [Mycena crocata]|nr:hypothetical protein C8R43DRAFT_1111466 [Mycena crocata]